MGMLTHEHLVDQRANAATTQAAQTTVAAARRLQLARKIQEELPAARAELQVLHQVNMQQDIVALERVVGLMEEAVGRLTLREAE